MNECACKRGMVWSGGGSRGISPDSVPSAKGAKYKGKGLLGEMTGGQTGAARTR